MRKALSPEIVVIAGEQTGARALLANNYSVTLSGCSDTDMVLRDASIDREKLKITTNNNKAYIEVIDGKIEIEGKTISKKKKLRLHDYAKVKLGDTVFVYTSEPHVPFNDVLIKTATEISTADSPYHTRKTNQFRNRILMSALATLVIVVSGISTVITTPKSADQISMAVPENIHSLLIENGYESLIISREDDNRIIIKGFVMTNKDRAQLEQLIDEYNVPAMLDLEIGDQLAMEVRELFRVNGIEVVASLVQEGEITVTAEKVSNKQLESIREIALKEINSLKSINIELAESTDEKETIGTDMSYKKADKRITMVVDGSPAYIMTSDQSKYYIGALLPTGYKVVNIANQKVVLEKQGKQKTLEF